jgi:hypothetical protein
MEEDAEQKELERTEKGAHLLDPELRAAKEKRKEFYDK